MSRLKDPPSGVHNVRRRPPTLGTDEFARLEAEIEHVRAETHTEIKYVRGDIQNLAGTLADFIREFKQFRDTRSIKGTFIIGVIMMIVGLSSLTAGGMALYVNLSISDKVKPIRASVSSLNDYMIMRDEQLADRLNMTRKDLGKVEFDQWDYHPRVNNGID